MNPNRRNTTDAVDIGDGWSEYLDDDDQRPYYVHEVSGQTTWDHPFPQRDHRRKSSLPPPPLPDEGVFDEFDSGQAAVKGGKDLPPGWAEWTDASGAKYYAHEDGSTTWTRPDAAQVKQPPPPSTPPPPPLVDALEVDIAMQMQAASLDPAQPSRPMLTREAHVAPAKAPPPMPSRPLQLLERLPQAPTAESTVIFSTSASWSAGCAAAMDALLQPFPTLLSRLRSSLKKDPKATFGPKPPPFPWYTLGCSGSGTPSQPLVLDADVLDLGGSLYYQSKGGLFKKSRSAEECLSYEDSPSPKPALQSNRDAGETVIGQCRRCCVLVMLYMGDCQLGSNASSDKDRDALRDNAISAASGSSRLVLIIRELLDLARSSVQFADEIYARVLKQLCNNYRAASVEAGWSLLLLLCSHVGCSDATLRFLMFILSKCIAVERDIITRSPENSWFAAHVVMLTLSHRNALRAHADAFNPFVDAEVENSFRKLKHLSPLYSYIEETIQLEAMFCPVQHAAHDMLTFVPRTLVQLTDLIHARGGFQTDGIFRLAGERACVARVRASISCRFPIVEADSDPLVVAEVSSLQTLSGLRKSRVVTHACTGAQAVASRAALPRHSIWFARPVHGVCRQTTGGGDSCNSSVHVCVCGSA